MAYVVAYLKQQGHAVFCLNLCHDPRPVREQISEAVIRDKIDVVCTGAMSAHWRMVEDVLVAAKSSNPKLITVLGGPIVTADPELAMEHLPVDFGVLGEGEITMDELAQALTRKECFPATVNGLIYRDQNGGLVKTQPRKAIENLDALPLPDYEAFGYAEFLKIRWELLPTVSGLFFDYDDNQKLAEIITSRGCPHACTFCYHPLGKKYRQRSLGNVFTEIDYLVRKFDVKLINILDELFSHNCERVTEFSERIAPYKVRYIVQWRVDNTDETVFKKLKDSGLLYLGLGVESMSQTVLDSMKKKITQEQVEAAFRWAETVGIRVSCNLIFGDPAETPDTARESLNWLSRHPERNIQVLMIKAIPDAEIWRQALARGIISDRLAFTTQGFPIVNLTRMSSGAFRALDRRVLKYELTLGHYPEAAVVESHPLSKADSAPLYHFVIKCPCCGGLSDYRYFEFYHKPYTPVVCKKCIKLLRIKTARAFPGSYSHLKGSLTTGLRHLYSLYLRQIKPIAKLAEIIKARHKK